MDESTREPVRNRRLALVGSVASGVAWGYSHAVEAHPLLAALALAPLLLALGGRRPFLVGWLSGTVAWCVAIPWIVPTITTYGQLDGWLAGLALLLLAAFLGLHHGLFAQFGAPLWRRGDVVSLAALPALWVTTELFRGWLASGFPWNLGAYAWTDLPGALPVAGWIGAFGVSALVVVVNVGVARSALIRQWEPAAVALLATAVALALGARFAAVPDPKFSGAVPLEVRVMQPDIPNRPFFDAAANELDYARLIEMSEALCEPGRLLLWPESAAWPRSWQDDARLRADVDRLVRRGCALLFNTSWEEGGRTYNSVLLVERGAGAAASTGGGLRIARADKRHLVPFGEFVPFRETLPFLGKIARTVGDFSPALEIRLLEFDGGKLGAAVCYEVVFPGETAALVRAGANLLVTVTNDAWYGDTAAPRQHLRAARFRAAENRRWLLRAAITGISAVVRPDGSLAGELPVGKRGTLVAAPLPRADRSPYTRAPWAVPWLMTLGAAAGWLRTRRARRR